MVGYSLVRKSFNVYVWGIVLVGANGYVKFNVRNKKIGDKRPLFIKNL